MSRKIKFKAALVWIFFGGVVFGLFASAIRGADFYAQGPRSEKKIALTFDDGPGPDTRKFLDLLARHNAKGTFFMLGELVRSEAAVVKDLAAQGHEIASHTYDHTNYKARLKENIKKFGETKELHPKAEAETKRELLASMKKAKALTEKVSGQKVDVCRMPHGIDAPWIRATAKEAGFVLVNWTYGADWTGASEADLIASYTQAIQPGAILLFHDGGVRREKTLAVTEAVLTAARQKGYAIVTVSDLLNIPR